MLETLKKIVKDLFTEDDNESADMIPVAAFAAFAVFLGLQIYVVVARIQPFDAVQFGTAVGVMLGALGLAFKLKRDAQTKPMAE